MTDIKQAATELLAAIDDIREESGRGYTVKLTVAVDRYAEAKAALREALKDGDR